MRTNKEYNKRLEGRIIYFDSKTHEFLSYIAFEFDKYEIIDESTYDNDVYGIFLYRNNQNIFNAYNFKEVEVIEHFDANDNYDVEFECYI